MSDRETENQKERKCLPWRVNSLTADVLQVPTQQPQREAEQAVVLPKLTLIPAGDFSWIIFCSQIISCTFEHIFDNLGQALCSSRTSCASREGAFAVSSVIKGINPNQNAEVVTLPFSMAVTNPACFTLISQGGRIFVLILLLVFAEQFDTCGNHMFEGKGTK